MMRADGIGFDRGSQRFLRERPVAANPDRDRAEQHAEREKQRRGEKADAGAEASPVSPGRRRDDHQHDREEVEADHDQSENASHSLHVTRAVPLARITAPRHLPGSPTKGPMKRSSWITVAVVA